MTTTAQPVGPVAALPATMSWWQPRNACLWVYVVLVGYGLYYTVSQVRDAVGPYGPALGLSAVIFACYAVPFWWFTTRIDRYSRLPVSLRIAAFGFGGFAATWAIALQGNSALISLYGKLVSPDFALDWGAGLSAPVFEELGKGSGVLLLLFIAPRLVRTSYDGFILGAFVGLGFEIIEDILYALNSAPEGFGVDQVSSSLHTVVLRLATGFTSHIAYASIFGAGLVYLVQTSWQPRRVGLGLGLCLTSMLLHGSWDAAAVLSGGNTPVLLGLLLGFIVLAVIAVLSTFRLTVRSERVALRTALQPDVDRGTLTPEELDALAGNRRARSRYRRRGHGRAAKRARSRRLVAARALADELALNGGVETAGVTHARQELTRSVRSEPAA